MAVSERKPATAARRACADQAILGSAYSDGAGTSLYKSQLDGFELDIASRASGEVDRHVFDSHVVHVRREILCYCFKAHRHRCRRLLGIVQVVPCISELVTEAEGAISTGCALRIQKLDNLLLVVEAVERRVLDGDQHVGDRRIIEWICCLGPTRRSQSCLAALSRTESLRTCSR